MVVDKVKKGTIVRIRIPKPLFERKPEKGKPSEKGELRKPVGESRELRESREGLTRLTRRSFLKRVLLFGGAVLAGWKLKKFIDVKARNVESQVFQPVFGRKPEFTHLNSSAMQVKKAIQNVLKNFDYNRVALERAAWFHDFISKHASENEIDFNLLHALIAQESRGAVNAESRAGACGLAQFIPETGEVYGLKPLKQVASVEKKRVEYKIVGDERFNPEKAVWAAARHLRDLIDYYAQREYLSEEQRIAEFNSKGPEPYAVFFALAAYNAGKSKVDEAIVEIRAKGRNPTWPAVAQLLPSETQAYVPLILAKKIILDKLKHFTEEHGLTISENAFGAYSKLLELSEEKPLKKTSINAFARKHGFNKEHLQLLNPELQASVWLKQANVLVPKKEKLKEFREAFKTFKNLRWNNFEFKGLKKQERKEKSEKKKEETKKEKKEESEKKEELEKLVQTTCEHLTLDDVKENLSKLVPLVPIHLTRFTPPS